MGRSSDKCRNYSILLLSTLEYGAVPNLRRYLCTFIFLSFLMPKSFDTNSTYLVTHLYFVTKLFAILAWTMHAHALTFRPDYPPPSTTFHFPAGLQVLYSFSIPCPSCIAFITQYTTTCTYHAIKLSFYTCVCLSYKIQKCSLFPQDIY